ncbi:VapE domain-containing protein [Hydrocarboniphaga sp.]|uniref:VapE domain-containing protein n=1 Tax=Hydrocarboniphaga sp. TaxID=2033016 RepID=UPI003D10ED30
MTDESLDPVNDALREMQAFGLLIDRIDFGPPKNGKAHRVDVEGQKKGKRAGWYICHEIRLNDGRTIVVGSYGIWQGTSERNAQRLKLRGAKLDDSARKLVKERQQELSRQAELAEVELLVGVQQRAKGIWDKLPGLITTEYLKRKGVRAYGLRAGRDGTVVIPLRNAAGLMTQLQFISADGGKKFLTGPGKKGSYHLIGEVTDEHPLVFAEGYATGASIHEATGWPVVVCFDGGNVATVAKALRVVYPSARFIFAGDEDHEKKENAGRRVATECAKRFSAKAVLPSFKEPGGRTDFNDLHAEQGIEAVRQQMLAAWTPLVQAASAGSDDAPWARQLVWGDKGLKVMPYNVMLVLENHPEWKGLFALDEFSKRVVKRRNAPYGAEAGELSDADEIEIAAWFGRRNTYGAAIPTMIAREACIALARRSKFHPVREYLDSLEWDGIERIAEFFPDFCKSARDDVTACFALNFFISAVARVRQPGCKADLMLVLEGEQGTHKSSLLNALCSDAWFADLGTSPSDKDFYVIIQGRWIVEIGELSSFAKSESSHIKRAVSARIDRFRSPYGRNAEDFPRECVFAGTVNNMEWNRDETGGRRYMPIWVDTIIDIAGVRKVRDQLWAEAVYRYDQGESWWKLPPGAAEEQEARYTEDIWAEKLYLWLQGKDKPARYKGGKPAKVDVTTASQILFWAFDVEHKKQDKAQQTRIGILMRRLKWQRALKRIGGTRIWQYTRPAGADTEEAAE